MHDVKKVRLAELTEKEKRFNQEKIDKFKELYDKCFTARDNKLYTRDILTEDLNRLNEINPENTSMWNYRRTLLQTLWAEAKAEAKKMIALDTAEQMRKLEAAAAATAAATGAAAEDAPEDEEGSDKPAPVDHLAVFAAQVGKDLKAELELNTTIVKKDPKCYAAFVHRQWIIDAIQPASKRIQVLEMEKAQLEKLLKVDERNFHAWGYRRWITTQLRETDTEGTVKGSWSDQSEMEFSKTKIGNNMSNYSAWHNRALVFRKRVDNFVQASKAGNAVDEDAKNVASELAEEMDLLVGAFYCDSKDQSAWLYGQWVMESLAKVDADAHEDKAKELLENCAELIEAEEEDLAEAAGEGATGSSDTPGFEGQVLSLKWPLWFSIVLHRQLQQSGKGSPASEEEIQKLIDRLCEVDRPRAVCFRAILGKKK